MESSEITTGASISESSAERLLTRRIIYDTKNRQRCQKSDKQLNSSRDEYRQAGRLNDRAIHHEEAAGGQRKRLDTGEGRGGIGARHRVKERIKKFIGAVLSSESPLPLLNADEEKLTHKNFFTPTHGSQLSATSD